MEQIKQEEKQKKPFVCYHIITRCFKFLKQMEQRFLLCKVIGTFGVFGSVFWIIGKLLLFSFYILGGRVLGNQVQKGFGKIGDRLGNIKSNNGNKDHEERERKQNAKKENQSIKPLIWFCAEWLKDGAFRNTAEFQRKQQFYQWLEANYQYHVLKQKKNRDEYFAGARKGGRYEAISQGGSWLYWAIGVGAAAIASSALKDSVLLPAINQLGILININQTFQPIISFLVILAVAVCIVFILYGFIAKVTIHYTKKIEDIQQKKETWVRHTEALYTYQHEMMDYIMGSGKYTKCLTQEEKEHMLINRMIAVWEHNGIRFQSNMKKEDENNKQEAHIINRDI